LNSSKGLREQGITEIVDFHFKIFILNRTRRHELIIPISEIRGAEEIVKKGSSGNLVRRESDMKSIIIIFVIGVLILTVIGVAYVWLGGFNSDISGTNANLANFGNYFGGVAGPLITFLSVILIVCTLHQQNCQMKVMFKENLKQDMIRYLNKLEEEISHLLTRPIPSENFRYVEFGDLVNGLETSAELNEGIYQEAMNKLLKLTASYCEAIALYRANVNEHFVFKAHLVKARDLVEFLERNVKYLYQMAPPTLAFCKMHLEGESKA
jgi:hypothetical protein